jgi:hypothetical protein
LALPSRKFNSISFSVKILFTAYVIARFVPPLSNMEALCLDTGSLCISLRKTRQNGSGRGCRFFFGGLVSHQ